MSIVTGYVEKCIRRELVKRFQPKLLEVINECKKYDVSEEDESYFKIVVVSDVFEGMPLIEVVKHACRCIEER